MGKREKYSIVHTYLFSDRVSNKICDTTGGDRERWNKSDERKQDTGFLSYLVTVTKTNTLAQLISV